MHCFRRNAFGAVDAAAAAEGNNGFAAVLTIGLIALFHIIGCRVGSGIGLQGVADAVCFKAIQHGLHLSAADHARSRHHQHIVDALFLQKSAQFTDLPRPLKIRRHPIAHKIIADFQHRLKHTTPNHIHFIRQFHLLPSLNI